MKLLYSIVLLLQFATNADAQQKAKPAKEILAAACKQAADSNKNVLIIFRASWCCWCKKMDRAINDAACKKFFLDNYVIEHLTVDEKKGKEYLENPGAKEMLLQYKVADTGVPVWLVLDKNGKLLGDSFIREAGKAPANMGCPASEAEVGAFIKILQQTSKLAAPELAVIAKRFRQNDQ